MHVVLRKGETFEQMLHRFKSGVLQEGILAECRRRQTFVSKSEQRRVRKRKAVARARRYLAKQRRASDSKPTF